MKVAFDQIANIYDQQFSYSEIGKLQRKEVWKYLDALLTTSDTLNILELNCGTGVDAIYMAKKGHKVLATDISGEMVKATLRKVSHHGLKDKVSVLQLGFDQLDEWFVGQRFDLVVSNFGGLNCIDSTALQRLAYDITGLLNPGGRFVAVVMPEKCMMETMYFSSKFRFKEAFRRSSSNPVMADLSGTGVATWYHSPKKVKRIFSGAFQQVQTKPIGFLVPPSYTEPFFSKHGWLLKMLDRGEQMLHGISGLSALSDHYLIDLELKR